MRGGCVSLAYNRAVRSHESRQTRSVNVVWIGRGHAQASSRRAVRLPSQSGDLNLTTFGDLTQDSQDARDPHDADRPLENFLGRIALWVTPSPHIDWMVGRIDASDSQISGQTIEYSRAERPVKSVRLLIIQDASSLGF